MIQQIEDLTKEVDQLKEEKKDLELELDAKKVDVENENKQSKMQKAVQDALEKGEISSSEGVESKSHFSIKFLSFECRMGNEFFYVYQCF